MNRTMLVGMLLAVSLIVIGIVYYFSEAPPELSSIANKQVAASTRDVSKQFRDKPASEPEFIVLEPVESSWKNEDFPVSSQVGFPGGSIANVSFQLGEQYSFPHYRIGELEKFYAELVAAVDAGNGSAAEALAALHEDCYGVPRDEVRHREELEQFQITGEFRPDPNSEQTIKLVPGSRGYDMVYKTMRDMYPFCKNVPAKDYEKRGELREKAVELGAPQALMRHADAIGHSEPQVAFSIYEELWDRGYVTVGNNLSRGYAQGIHTGSENTPDLIRSYAYQLATTAVFTQAGNEFRSDSMSPQSNPQGFPYSSLTPSEHLEAEELAVRLLEENSECCKGLWR